MELIAYSNSNITKNKATGNGGGIWSYLSDIKILHTYEKEYGNQQVDDFVDTTATDAGKDYVSKALAAISK